MPRKCGIFTTLNHQASPLNSNSSVKFSLMKTFSTLEQTTHTSEYSPERMTCTSRHSPRGWHTTRGSWAPATRGRAAAWARGPLAACTSSLPLPLFLPRTTENRPHPLPFLPLRPSGCSVPLGLPLPSGLFHPGLSQHASHSLKLRYNFRPVYHKTLTSTSLLISE